ncbi:MAG: transposase [Candidatus Omnitrophota bacterium]
MARIARIEALDYPHHVIQRGNRSQEVFFSEEDKQSYMDILKLQKELFGFEVWAYCLMDNHVHLIVVPRKKGGMIQGIGETHRLYTRMINFRHRWRGYLWQGRFKSFVMDEQYLVEAIRYIELNPVKAGMVKSAEDYEYSSAQAHIKKVKDDVLDDFYLLKKIKKWKEYLGLGASKAVAFQMKTSELTGRPLGSEDFLKSLEILLGRTLIKKKPGPKSI